MKTTERLFYLIILIGFSIKPLHIPGHTLVIMLGLLSLFIFYLFCFITSARPVAYTITGFAVTFIMTSVLCHLKFFPFATYVMDFTALLVLLAIYFTMRARTWYMVLSTYMILLCATQAFIIWQPKHKLYYFLNIKYNQHIEMDYITWDKYSWFLYIEKQYDAAEKANEKALAILSASNDPGLEKTKRAYTEHGNMIRNKKWKKFRSEKHE